MHADLSSVMPRHQLTMEERLVLSPCLARHLAAINTPRRRTIRLNQNYQTVASRYQKPLIERDAAHALVSPGREEDGAKQMSSNRTQSPSLARFPNTKSRYLDDVRLRAPSHDGGATEHSNPSRRSPTPSRRGTSPAPRASDIRTPSPFKAGVRPATPDEVSRRNRRLLASARKPTTAVTSVVRQYIQSTPRVSLQRQEGSVGRSRTPDRRNSSPQRSPHSRARSPAPVKKSIVEETLFLEQWRADRTHTRVAADHVPRVATLSVGYQVSREASPQPVPILHWVPTPSPNPPSAVRRAPPPDTTTTTH